MDMCRPGIEPGPPAWKAGIITIRLTALVTTTTFASTDEETECHGERHPEGRCVDKAQSQAVLSFLEKLA